MAGRTLSSEEQDRFIASLAEDAAFREKVRRSLLTEELLSLPDRFAAFVEEMRTFVEEMHTFVDATNKRFEALERDVGDLKGTDLERRVRDHPRRYLEPLARHFSNVDDLVDALDDDAYLDVIRADLIVKGTGPRHEERIFVVEAAWRAHVDEVTRAKRRASLLAPVAPLPVVPVVFSDQPPGDAVVARARSEGVDLVVEKDFSAAS